MPEDIVQADLQKMDPNCVRSFTNSDFPTKDLGLAYENWEEGIDYIYLDPSGIKRGTPYSYNDNTVAELKARNPDLASLDFNTVRGRNAPIEGIDKRPYPIISTTLMSPRTLLPTSATTRVWDLLEFTPLATGIAFSEEVTYTNADDSEYITMHKG